jgi:DNA-binding HxlR family transcriptional regulator
VTIEAFSKQHCAIAQTLAVVGERWTLLILRELFLGRRRFEQMQSELGIASNILSARLATLLDEGIVERRPYSSHPGRYEYRLTETGAELQPVLLALLAWGDRHKVDAPPVVTVHTDCGHEMHAQPACSHCGGELTTRNVRPQLGPGASDRQRTAEARRRAA